jgi:uncharacterized protein (TIGR02117 family)
LARTHLSRVIEFLGVALLSVLTYFGAAGVLGAIPVNRGYAPVEDGVEVCLRSNGIHADYVFPVRHDAVDWRARHPAAHFARMARQYEYIAFGWGDRAFYLETPTWADLKPGTALRAVSGLGSAAMHVEYTDRPRPGEQVACTRVSETQYQGLVSYVQTSFKPDEAGALMKIDAPGYGATDAFYEAKGAYNLFLTCNEWVRRGLSESGIRAPAWSPFDGALLRQLRSE